MCIFQKKAPEEFRRREKKRTFASSNAVVAQLVEHQLPKLRVAGSNPVYRSQSGSFARIF